MLAMYFLIAFRAISLQLTSGYFPISFLVFSSNPMVMFRVTFIHLTHFGVHTHSSFLRWKGLCCLFLRRFPSYLVENASGDVSCATLFFFFVPSARHFGSSVGALLFFRACALQLGFVLFLSSILDKLEDFCFLPRCLAEVYCQFPLHTADIYPSTSNPPAQSTLDLGYLWI